MRIETAIVLFAVLVPGCLALPQGQDSVSLDATKQLRSSVDAWPLISHPSTPAERHANDVLHRLNENMASSLKGCDVNYREWASQVHQPLTGKNAVEHDWERTITVTMTGPRFLSIVAIDGYVFCGGAHPNRDTLAMVFDLTTGKPVNWMNFIGKLANASAYSDSNSDGTTVGALIVPKLRAMALANAKEECKEAFQNPQSFQLWPDAKSGTLIAEPFGLPHVVAACAEELALTPDQARKMGFDETLLSAIAQAHRQFAASAISPAKPAMTIPAALASVPSEVKAKSRLPVAGGPPFPNHRAGCPIHSASFRGMGGRPRTSTIRFPPLTCASYPSHRLPVRYHLSNAPQAFGVDETMHVQHWRVAGLASLHTISRVLLT
jgi:hypothetical protein